MNRLKQKLMDLIKSNKYEYIFVDGFLIFQDKVLANLFDKKYFLLLNKEESRQRRLNRTYRTVDSPNYFDKCVWIEYMKYKQMCELNYEDIVYLDASCSTEQLSRLIQNNLNELRKNQIVN